ncbi:malonate transporter subunit MadL [Streptomyces sp. NPDC051677]|uniref:malonate transporter subunit MadL n=1 Tax=Streptomyces sp. NPDC051677 TaxID=3365669 RepID=UPI0037D1A626
MSLSVEKTMVIYGVAALAVCMLVGATVGELLGAALNVDANIGGVGFAMIMLIVVTHQLRRKGLFPEASEQGVLFWSAMYIPIVVGMASAQNVVKAVSGGPMAILAGLGAAAVGFALVPVVARIGGSDEPLEPLATPTADEKQEA